LAEDDEMTAGIGGGILFEQPGAVFVKFDFDGKTAGASMTLAATMLASVKIGSRLMVTSTGSERSTEMVWVHSSLKERSGQAESKIEALLSCFRIIPGDWGKVGSGWLARLL
jgi:hypothetical protein